TLTCGHKFCTGCISNTPEKRLPRCPLCLPNIFRDPYLLAGFTLTFGALLLILFMKTFGLYVSPWCYLHLLVLLILAVCKLA
ncbi:hypothetical protein Bhyg_00676, partial [Pseudolycoriella hygida]